MKLLTLIVHTDVQHDLTRLLRSMDQVSGYTFSHVEGHGTETENDAFLSARDQVVGHVPRTRADILLTDGDLDAVLAVLCNQENNIVGQGIYFVTDVAQGGHIL